MQHTPSTTETALLSAILEKNPDFGSWGYVLAKIHTPNAPGPGPGQRPGTKRGRPTINAGRPH